MSTGYTSSIVDNHDITFEEFALVCVRGMGVSIMMRDEPMDKKITRDSIVGESSEYHSEQIKDAVKRLEEINNTSPEDNDFRKRTEDRIREDLSQKRKELKKIQDLRKAYIRMLEKINEWEPPTEDHQGFKDFMVRKVTESIKWDCNEKYLLDNIKRLEGPINFEEEYESEKKEALSDIEYHDKELDEERERKNERIEWMEKLCESIGVEFE